MSALRKIDYEALDDLALARLVAARDGEAVRLVTTRNNQRLFRAAWGILKVRADAEDAVQSGYLKAFAAIGSFTGAASLSTWLTRIVINEALGRLRAEKRRHARLDPNSVVHLEHYKEQLMRGSMVSNSPEQQLAVKEIRRMIEQAVAALPQPFRVVFILRDVEGMSVEEAAEALGIVAATVKTRLHRARRLLQAELTPELAPTLADTFPFAGVDCARMTARVIAGLGLG